MAVAQAGGVHRPVEHLLREAEDLGRRAGDPVGEGVDLGRQPIGRNDAVHEPDPLGLGRVDEVAGEQQLAGLLLADEGRHEQRDGR